MLLFAALIFVAGCAGTTVQQDPTHNENAPQAEALDRKAAKLRYETAKSKYSARKNEGTKKPYVDAAVTYATILMAGDGKPAEKYPEALRLYDEALVLDPGNDEAIANRQLIIDIYKSLGKEPPR